MSDSLVSHTVVRIPPLGPLDSRVSRPNVRTSLRTSFYFTIPEAVTAGPLRARSFVNTPAGRAAAALSGIFMDFVSHVFKHEDRRSAVLMFPSRGGDGKGDGEKAARGRGRGRGRGRRGRGGRGRGGSGGGSARGGGGYGGGGGAFDESASEASDGEVAAEEAAAAEGGDSDFEMGADAMHVAGRAAATGEPGGEKVEDDGGDGAAQPLGVQRSELLVEPLYGDNADVKPRRIVGYRYIFAVSSDNITFYRRLFASYLERRIEHNAKKMSNDTYAKWAYERMVESGSGAGAPVDASITRRPGDTIDSISTLRAFVSAFHFGSAIAAAVQDSAIEHRLLADPGFILNPAVLFGWKNAFRRLDGVCEAQSDPLNYMVLGQLHFPCYVYRMPRSTAGDIQSMMYTLPWSLAATTRKMQRMYCRQLLVNAGTISAASIGYGGLDGGLDEIHEDDEDSSSESDADSGSAGDDERTTRLDQWEARDGQASANATAVAKRTQRENARTQRAIALGETILLCDDDDKDAVLRSIPRGEVMEDDEFGQDAERAQEYDWGGHDVGGGGGGEMAARGAGAAADEDDAELEAMQARMVAAATEVPMYGMGSDDALSVAASARGGGGGGGGGGAAPPAGSARGSVRAGGGGGARSVAPSVHSGGSARTDTSLRRRFGKLSTELVAALAAPGATGSEFVTPQSLEAAKSMLMARPMEATYAATRERRVRDARTVYSLMADRACVPPAVACVMAHLKSAASNPMLPGIDARQVQQGCLLPPTEQTMDHAGVFENMILYHLNAYDSTLRVHNTHFTLLLCLLSSLSSWVYLWELHPNILLLGGADASKTFLIELLQSMMLHGTWRKQQYMTGKADTVAKNVCGETEFWSEMSPQFMGIDPKAAAAARAKGQSGGPNEDLTERGAITKERMTSMRVEITYAVHSSSNGVTQRANVTVQYLCIGAIIMAANAGVEWMADPMLSRIIVVSVLNTNRADGRLCGNGGATDPSRRPLYIAEMQNLQALVAAVCTLMRGGIFGGDVDMNLLDVYYPRLELELRNAGYNVTGNRVRQNVIMIARVLTVVYGIHVVFQCKEARMHAGKAFQPDQLVELGLLMWVNKKIMVFASSMVFLVVYGRQDTHDVLGAIKACLFDSGSNQAIGGAYLINPDGSYDVERLQVADTGLTRDGLVTLVVEYMRRTYNMKTAPSQVTAVLRALENTVSYNKTHDGLPPIVFPAHPSLPEVKVSDLDASGHLPRGIREKVGEQLDATRASMPGTTPLRNAGSTGYMVTAKQARTADRGSPTSDPDAEPARTAFTATSQELELRGVEASIQRAAAKVAADKLEAKKTRAQEAQTQRNRSQPALTCFVRADATGGDRAGGTGGDGGGVTRTAASRFGATDTSAVGGADAQEDTSMAPPPPPPPPPPPAAPPTRPLRQQTLAPHTALSADDSTRTRAALEAFQADVAEAAAVPRAAPPPSARIKGVKGVEFVRAEGRTHIIFSTRVILRNEQPREVMQTVFRNAMDCEQQAAGEVYLLGYPIHAMVPWCPDYLTTRAGTPGKYLRGPTPGVRTALSQSQYREMEARCAELDDEMSKLLASPRGAGGGASALNTDMRNEVDRLLTQTHMFMEGLALNRKELYAAHAEGAAWDDGQVVYADVDVETATYLGLVERVDLYTLHDPDDGVPTGVAPVVTDADRAEFPEKQRHRVDTAMALFPSILDERVRRNMRPSLVRGIFPESLLPWTPDFDPTIQLAPTRVFDARLVRRVDARVPLRAACIRNIATPGAVAGGAALQSTRESIEKMRGAQITHAKEVAGLKRRREQVARREARAQRLGAPVSLAPHHDLEGSQLSFGGSDVTTASAPTPGGARQMHSSHSGGGGWGRGVTGDVYAGGTEDRDGTEDDAVFGEDARTKRARVGAADSGANTTDVGGMLTQGVFGASRFSGMRGAAEPVASATGGLGGMESRRRSVWDRGVTQARGATVGHATRAPDAAAHGTVAPDAASRLFPAALTGRAGHQMLTDWTKSALS